jgi:WD40 repeat protein
MAAKSIASGCRGSSPIGVFGVDEDFCVRLLSFSPDARYLAIASYDVQKEVRVWDLAADPNRAQRRRTSG